MNNSIDMAKSLLSGIFKAMIEEIIEAEMDVFIGYEKNSIEGNNSGNSRNGYSKRTLIGSLGQTIINVPRDRNGLFASILIGKHKTKIPGLEDKLISIFFDCIRGNCISEDNLIDLYGKNVSEDLIKNISSRLEPFLYRWRNLAYVYAPNKLSSR